jgi:hypothetical protein
VLGALNGVVGVGGGKETPRESCTWQQVVPVSSIAGGCNGSGCSRSKCNVAVDVLLSYTNERHIVHDCCTAAISTEPT